jgi:hypothetical protein
MVVISLVTENKRKGVYPRYIRIQIKTTNNSPGRVILLLSLYIKFW